VRQLLTDPADHPRPQLRREARIDLDGPWRFAYDDADVGLRERWFERPDRFDREILVPFPPESTASGIGDRDPHDIVWYRRTFELDPDRPDGRVLVHFGAVDYRAQVWVNDQLVGTHEGGHVGFSVDVTCALRRGPEQTIVVRAEDRASDLTQPRGKQTWERQPRRIWYHRTTGIWQPVWLELVPDRFIADVRWQPDLDRGLVLFEVTLDRPLVRPARLRVRLSVRGDVLADDVYLMQRQHLRRALTLEPALQNAGRRDLLWSPGHPNLIDAELTLEGDGANDRVESYFGARSTAFRRGLFLLNNVPTYLRLVLDQGYWPDSHLAAPDADALRRDAELTKALGFNGVRIHQKVEDPRFLYWCDRLGLLVWSEMANAYAFDTGAVERFTREWLEVVARYRSHPSIVTWVPFNESWGVPNLVNDPAQQAYVRGIQQLTKALDPTRPVIGNDGWEHFASDAWGVHDYALDGNVIRERYGTFEALQHTLEHVQPHYRPIVLEPGSTLDRILLTECGGFAYRRQEGERWFGYGSVSDPEELLAAYDDLIGGIQDCPTISGFCYTQLTDTLQEANGLLTERREPKVPLEAISRINRRPSRAVEGDVIAQIHEAADPATPVTTSS
jgi:beta-galactosidase/beta-glucuronidase